MRFVSLVTLMLALTWVVPAAEAASARTIDRRTNDALSVLSEDKPAIRDLLERAAGYLVFPRIYKAGLGFGGEYGEGALRVAGQTVGYYNIVSGSVGLQLGVQRRSVAIVFMDHRALERFRTSEGWRVGVDASVVVAAIGAGGAIDQNTASQPVIAVIFDERGLMYNLNLEGSKISRLNK